MCDKGDGKREARQSCRCYKKQWNLNAAEYLGERTPEMQSEVKFT